MKTSRRFFVKGLCILLCLILLAGYLPLTPLADHTLVSDRVADPSTMDSWKTFFHTNQLSTDNAGAVWTDKSVFTDESAFTGTGITRTRENGFLAALSAMGSNMSVTGSSNVPTDTILILDLSSSMYSGFDRDPATVNIMLASVNQSIEQLQSLNRHNRVGVVIYYGGTDRNPSTAHSSMTLLPLDRYTCTSTYLTANVTEGKLISVAVQAGVKNSAGVTLAQTAHAVTDVAGTYAQLGILDAMTQFLEADTVVPGNNGEPSSARTPVFIFMSDGEPTAATYDYTQKTDAAMGNNTVSIRNPNETDFVTQLTAAYAKEMVDAHYEKTTPLFYTLSLGSSVSLSVMDPANHTSATMESYWEHLITQGYTDITVYNAPNGWGAPTVKEIYTVKPTTVQGAAFPEAVEQKNYVNKTFTAATVSTLTDTFTQIIDQINLVSKYTPTLVSGNADLSGYVSFVDKVGAYMKVTDIKGILINDQLYSGVDLARNFVTGGGELGTYDAPSKLGDEMVHAVQTRLGLTSADAARTLITLAYECGQLSYTSDTEYSNYIGWYANAQGQFLGFWHEGVELPQATGNAATDPAYTIKSYGYLGAVDESHGVHASDLMYATVQVREHIETSGQMVVFAVPAALIPLVSYEVTLDTRGNMQDLSLTGAQHPIRLVYEVGLDETLHEGNVKSLVSQEYLAANTNPDGSIRFYTNQYEADGSIGYGKVNTYSYFNPSRENDKYYYLADTPVYTDRAGTRYTGSAHPKGDFYRLYTIYTESGIQTLYRRISDAALATAQQAQDGSWYIGAGTVHVNLDGYTIPKSENTTGTLPHSSIPFVDTHDHSVGDLGYRFIVGSTLGNNGQLTLMPETGIVLTKRMAEDTMDTEEAFSFVITNLTDPEDSRSYPAWLNAGGKTNQKVFVSFTHGTATVSLQPGQTLYIEGMADGITYRIEEVQTLDYIPQTDAFTITLNPREMTPVTFINAPRGMGNLLLSKEVLHELGSNYTIPEGKSFQLHVSLSGVGVANATFPAVHIDDRISSVTTDENGCFQVTLEHDQQLEIFGLPEGTVVQVTEPNPGAGFTCSYEENGQAGDGILTIPEGLVDIAVINRYEPSEAPPASIRLQGEKKLLGSDWNDTVFAFELQKWTEEGWVTIHTATADKADPTFDFTSALAQEKFTHPGYYHYQVKETNGGQIIDGISYDATLHTFTVEVTDLDMDGRLEIHNVVSTHTGRPFHQDDQGNWDIQITFTNQYHAPGCELVLDVLKQLENPSDSPLVSSAGFQFGLYQSDRLVARSELSDGAGEARLMLHYEPSDVGIHSYTLKEIIPEDRLPGMLYDETSYTVTVQVTDLEDGTMQAEILTINGKTDFSIPVFTNRYLPQKAVLNIDFVTKVLTGRELIPGEFDFELRSTDFQQVITGTNDAHGQVQFSQPLSYDAVGIYHYDLKETTPSGSGVVADDRVYTVRVAVVDVGGQLTADYAVLNLVGTDVRFENTYQAQPVTYALDGIKELQGRELLNEEFSFLLIQTISEGGMDKPLHIQQVRNLADGRFHFHPITFAFPGRYTFKIQEVGRSSADYGIVYDDTCYQVAITVTDNLKGQLEISHVQLTTGDAEQADTLRFTNRYVPASATLTISGQKELIGNVLQEGDFQFELYQADENWNPIALVETAENTAQGSFSFTPISYDQAGLQYYLVREARGGETQNGIVYDDTQYRVLVEITDNLRGQLEAQASISDDQGIVREEIRFHNLYAPVDGASVTLEGTKTLTGKALQDGAFTFLLHETGADFLPSGAPMHTATNQDGRFTMTLTYDASQLGSTHYYTVTEEHAGQTMENILYSDAVYHVTVTLTDDGSGGILPLVSITQGTRQVQSLDFVNEYLMPPAEVTLSGTKELVGKPLESGEFTFLLYESDSSWNQGSQIHTAVNDAQGHFTFPSLTLDTPGTYYYLVKELHGGQVIDHVLHDDTVYRITIQVTDQGKDQLEYTLDIRTQKDDAPSSLVFQNRYAEQPPKTQDLSLQPLMILLLLSCTTLAVLLLLKKKTHY